MKVLPFTNPPRPDGGPEEQHIHSQGPPSRPNPEVRPSRRSFTAAFKRQIIARADSLKHGELGPLLRENGLTHAHLAAFRRALKLYNLEPQKVGRKPKSELERENEALKLRVVKLEAELDRAQIIAEYQKKMALLLSEPQTEVKS